MILLAEDSGASFDEDTWGVTPVTPQKTIYTGPGLVSQTQDLATQQNTEGYEQLVSQYTCRLPQDAQLPETVRGNVLQVVRCERSPELNGEEFIIMGERHSSFRVSRVLILQRREPRRQA